MVLKRILGFTPQPVEKQKRGRSSSSISLSHSKVAPVYSIQKLSINDMITVLNDDNNFLNVNTQNYQNLCSKKKTLSTRIHLPNSGVLSIPVLSNTEQVKII